MDTIKPTKKNLTSDLLAGLTFALVNIPQSMAHALLASVNPSRPVHADAGDAGRGAVHQRDFYERFDHQRPGRGGWRYTEYPSVRYPTNRAGHTGAAHRLFQIVLGLLRLGWVTRFIPFR